MKKVLKIIGVLLGVVVVAAAALATFIHFRGIPKYDVQEIELAVESTPERVARGKQIFQNLCLICHQDPTTQRATGKQMTDIPSAFGTAYSRNITRHATQGVGAWTDGELAWILRTGIHPKTGSYVPPWMIKMPLVSDEDLHSIIAFLRSDDPRVAAADVPNRTSQPGFLVKALSTFAWKPFPYPKAPIPPPDKQDKLAYGRYLADALYSCYACHSADFKTLNELEPHKSAGYYAGGNPIIDVNGKLLPSSNLTPDEQTGIGKWSEAEFTRAVREGFRPDGTLLHAPMELYGSLPDEEVSAIYAYLRTVPAVRKQRAAGASYAKLAAGGGGGRGQAAYYQYGCQYCHGTTGVGTADLRRATAKFPGDDAAIVAWIKNPGLLVPGTRMPKYDGVIAEADYAPLVAYVRTLGAGTSAAR